MSGREGTARRGAPEAARRAGLGAGGGLARSLVLGTCVIGHVSCDTEGRAEPAAEATVSLAGVGAAGKIVVAGGVEFVDGGRIDEIEVAPAPARPGEALSVRFTVGGATGGELRVGLRTPRGASRQEVRPRGEAGAAADPRERWQAVAGAAGAISITFEVPAPWHAEAAVIEVEAVDASGGRVPARAGARRDDGRGVVAVVAVARAPTRVVARRADAPPRLDGELDEVMWAGEGPALVDSLDGEPLAGAPTRAWLAWDEAALYLAADLPDADLWSTFTAQDEPLYHEEVLELFVAADGEGSRYLEYQVSPRGVTFDARFTAYRRGDEGWDSRWQTAVVALGTVDDASDRDLGWRAEVAIPWAEICANTALACPPRAGQTLRVNVFRIERRGRKEAIGMALSPTLRPDFHAWANAAVLELR